MILPAGVCFGVPLGCDAEVVGVGDVVMPACALFTLGTRDLASPQPCTVEH